MKCLPLILLCSMVCAFVTPKASAQNCLSGWQYRMPVDVTNPNAGALTDHQVLVTVNTQALISAGKMQANGEDIRFATNCCDIRCHWVESGINTTTTNIWVNVANVPASGTSTVYMYYGNATANDSSSAACTFDIFDDFDGSLSAFNANCGNATTNFTGSTLNLSWSSNGVLVSNDTLSQAYTYTAEASVTGTGGTWPALYWIKASDNKNYGLMINTTQARISVVGGGTTICSGHNWASGLVPFTGTTGIWSFTWVATGNQIADFPTIGAITATDALYPKDADLMLGLGGISSGSGNMDVEWIRARKYAAADPTHVVGAEMIIGGSQIVNLSANDTTVCVGDNIPISAGSGFTNYTWSTGDTISSITTSGAGTYTVWATDSAGCTSIDSVVLMEQSPTVTITADTTVCNGDTASLDAGSGYLTYTWSTGASSQVAMAAGGTHYVDVTDSLGCVGSDTAVVAEFAPVTPNLGADINMCPGDTANLDAGAGYVAYSWSSGGTSQMESVTSAGTYTVTVTDTNTCTGQDMIDVIFDVPTAAFTSVDNNLMVTFTNTSTAGSTYLWDFGDGNTSTSQDPTHTYAAGGTYLVCLTTTSASGCTDSTCTSVMVGVTGINENLEAQFSIYPNPVQDVLTIDSQLSERASYTVVDVAGKVISRGFLQVGINRINVEQLSSGVYVLQISAMDKTITERIMVE